MNTEEFLFHFPSVLIAALVIIAVMSIITGRATFAPRLVVGILFGIVSLIMQVVYTVV